MIRTLIVDDQNIIRKGVKALLEDSTEIELVGFAEDGETAIKKVEATRPNVVLLDINLPDIDGLTIAERISAKFPQTKIIILSSCEDRSYVRKAMASSAKGYLLKSVSARELEWSIKLVHQGYSAFKSELLDSIDLDNQEASIITKEKVEAEALNTQKKPVLPSSQPSGDSVELDLLLARNQVRRKYSAMRRQRHNLAFHDVNISKAKKTMMSFEFKLLVLIIFFSLGFLVFVALS